MLKEGLRSGKHETHDTIMTSACLIGMNKWQGECQKMYVLQTVEKVLPVYLNIK